MSTVKTGYEDITEGNPRVTTREENGIRTTTKTTRLGPDPSEKAKETVTVRKVDRPDATETITVTEKKLPPMRYTETVTREKLPVKPTEIVQRERIIDEPTKRVVKVRQITSPVVLDVSTPPLTTRRTTTYVDDRKNLVNYQDEYRSTRRTGQRTEWCDNCGENCCGCDCFDDCCRTNSFSRRKDVVSYQTRVTKDGRRVRYRNDDVPGYRCCNCCTGWCSRVCPCCACLEWFCACPCWLWLCCLIPLLLILLGLSIGLLTQLPAISSSSSSSRVRRTLRQTINETWYVYGLDQPCSGSATTFPPSLSTITTLIPCALTTTSWARIIQATTVYSTSKTCKTFLSSPSSLILVLIIWILT